MYKDNHMPGYISCYFKTCPKTQKDKKEKNIEKLILYSNTKLASAIHLYKKYGFTEIELEQGLYERANIKMEILI